MNSRHRLDENPLDAIFTEVSFEKFQVDFMIVEW